VFGFLLMGLTGRTRSRCRSRVKGFFLADCGFIEFRFEETWTFDFMALDAARVELDERKGDSPLKTRRYEFGEVIVATRTTGSRMIFAEVVREV
jgi:hypothetical protein